MVSVCCDELASARLAVGSYAGAFNEIDAAGVGLTWDSLLAKVV